MSQHEKYYLIGFMGAGKTLVGSRMADLMGLEFLDLDRVVEAEVSRKIADIFAEQGEAEFRRLESRALRSVADRECDLVVATGGGTPTRQVNVDLMHSTGTTVWIDPPIEVVLYRLDSTHGRGRPLFESRDRAKELFEERCDAYSNADLRIGVRPNEEPDETAERIVRILSENETGRQP